LHGQGAPAGRTGPAKREGDGRSPAGVFELGTLRGYASTPPAGSKLPYEASGPDQRCVDDPASPFYNRIITTHSSSSFRSAERMRRDDSAYTLAIDVDHNRSPVTPGHGSCIFIHVWAAPDRPVTGCTGLALPDVTQLARWRAPGAVMVALPLEEYKALRGVWALPSHGSGAP
jgi:L,D-peptidoglycan transpeptidase YkuD (ErfK/YbiS/YcfS/YnhG family)